MTRKIVLFAAVGRKPSRHRTENQIKARTKLLSNSFPANTLTASFFFACFPRFPSSMELWAKVAICIHDALQCCWHQSTWAISDREGPDSRESRSVYISKLAVQTSYTTSSRFCSPHVRWTWREICRFSPSGKTGCSEQLMCMARLKQVRFHTIFQ